MTSIDTKKFVLSLPFDRYISYILDIVLVSGITSIILSFFHYKQYLYLIFVYYRTDHHKIFQLIISIHGIITLVVFLTILFLYFLIETYTGCSIGKCILNMKIAELKNETLKLKIIRALIKTCVPVILISSIYIFKSKLRQSFTDYLLGYVVIYRNQSQKFRRYLLISTLLFAISIGSEIATVIIFPNGLGVLTPLPNSGIILKPSKFEMNFFFKI